MEIRPEQQKGRHEHEPPRASGEARGEQEVEVVVEPAKEFDLGAGPGKAISRRVKGGTVGILFDARGRMVAQANTGTPGHINSLAAAGGHLHRMFEGRVVAGDVLITNDPWLSAGHFFDITLFTPVFLVSATTLMCDVPMLALWLGATLAWMHGIERGRTAWLATAAGTMLFNAGPARVGNSACSFAARRGMLPPSVKCAPQSQDTP